MPDLLFEPFSEEIPTQARAIDHLLPSLRARSAWWGGVGGGGWSLHRTPCAVDHRARRAVSENTSYVLSTIDAAVNADRPPTPDPSPPPSAGGGE
jgi:hypothetical protein